MGEQYSRLQQAIADERPGISQKVLRILRSQSGRQDSNLRPSDPKAPVSQNTTDPTRNKLCYSKLADNKRKFMSLKK